MNNGKTLTKIVNNIKIELKINQGYVGQVFVDDICVGCEV